MASRTSKDQPQDDRAAAVQKVADAQAKADQPDATADDAAALDAARAELAALPPAVVQPQQYAPGEGFGVGDRATENRYGTLDPAGNVTPTANNGKAELKGGERGTIVVVKGDTVTAEHRRVLGITG